MPKSITHKGIIFTREIFNYLESAHIDLVYHKPSKQIRIYIDYGDGCHDQYTAIKQVIDQANRQLHDARIQYNLRNSHPQDVASIRSTQDYEFAVNSTLEGSVVAGDPIPFPIPNPRSSSQNAGMNDDDDDQDDYDDEDPDNAER